jgi:AcrR family transcriptional regulator
MGDKNNQKTNNKEVAIYKAIIELINEGADVSAMKVGDITARAGIGKGTAYEYFESKEEMVQKALFYYIMEQIERAKALVESKEKFEDRFMAILDYMVDNKNEIRPFLWIIRMRKSEVTDMEQGSGEILQCLTYLSGLAEWFLAFGDAEGLIKETNKNFRVSALLSQIVQFGFYLHLGGEDDIEALKKFIYHGFLSQLN